MSFFLFPYPKIVLMFKSNVHTIIYLAYFPETEKNKKSQKYWWVSKQYRKAIQEPEKNSDWPAWWLFNCIPFGLFVL